MILLSKRFAVWVVCGVFLWTGRSAWADPPPGSGSPPPPKSPATPPVPDKPSIPDRAALEKQFAEMLSGATFTGFSQTTLDAKPGETATLKPPQPDHYSISKATKIAGDYWVIAARIRYGEKDVTIPVPVRVVWAEDTPMITLTDASLPMLGTYSARVVIHRGFYSGVWYGEGCHGGVLAGQIVKDADAPKADSAPPSPDTPRDDTSKSPPNHPHE